MSSTSLVIWLLLTTSIANHQTRELDRFPRKTDCEAAVEALTPSLSAEKTKLTCEPKEVKKDKQ